MTLNLYSVSDDNNKLNKTLGTATSITATVHEESNVINPTFIISGSYFDPDLNYCHASDFGRYYYIEDITIEHQRIILKCHVDVLMSFATEIGGLTVIADRSSSKYNLYQRDTELPMEARNRITMSPFSGSFVGEGIVFIATGNG